VKEIGYSVIPVDLGRLNSEIVERPQTRLLGSPPLKPGSGLARRIIPTAISRTVLDDDVLKNSNISGLTDSGVVRILHFIAVAAASSITGYVTSLLPSPCILRDILVISQATTPGSIFEAYATNDNTVDVAAIRLHESLLRWSGDASAASAASLAGEFEFTLKFPLNRPILPGRDRRIAFVLTNNTVLDIYMQLDLVLSYDYTPR